jgi:hypothetical protein
MRAVSGLAPTTDDDTALRQSLRVGRPGSTSSRVPVWGDPPWLRRAVRQGSTWRITRRGLSGDTRASPCRGLLSRRRTRVPRRPVMVIMDPGSSCPWPGPSGGARGDGGGGPCPRCGSTSRVCQRQTSASSPPKGMEPLTPGTFPLQTGFFLGTAGRDHHRLLGPWARRRLAKWRRAIPPLWQYFVCVCVCVEADEAIASPKNADPDPKSFSPAPGRLLAGPRRDHDGDQGPLWPASLRD